MQRTTTPPNSSACIAMDIGGTNLRVALVTREGRILQKTSIASQIDAGLDVFLQSITTIVASLLAPAKQAGIEVVAVGAGIPGLVASDGTILSCVNLRPLDGFNLCHWLENTLHLPAATLNDANAAAMAEKDFGAGKPFASLLHFTLGTGVGSGLILEGKLWTGSSGIAAEYGHATVEPEGRLCTCGNHGCLEQYASATAIARLAGERIAAGEPSTLAALPPEAITAADVAAAAAQGDRLAHECFRSAGRYLGIAAATAINLLNLEAIIVGGGVAESFPLLAPAIKEELRARAFAAAAAGVALLPGNLGDDAGILGAAATAWKLVDRSGLSALSRR